MIRVVPMPADENFNNSIVRGVLRRSLVADIVRVQDVGLSGADDPTVLEWAAENNRVLITHDVTTLSAFAYERIAAGLALPGVFSVLRTVPLKAAIDELVLIAECSELAEWAGQVRYLPLR